jgi:hypothetical protein
MEDQAADDAYKARISELQAANLVKEIRIAELTDELTTADRVKLTNIMTIKELKERISQLTNDSSDIYYYLNKKCDDNFEVIQSLEGQLLNEQTDREINEKINEKRIEELEHRIKMDTRDYTDRIKELEIKLEEFIIFDLLKTQFEQEISDLKTQLAHEKSENQANILLVERKLMLERMKLQNEYALLKDGLDEEVEKKVEARLSNEAKNAIQVNNSIRKELQYQNKQANSILHYDTILLENEKKIKIDLQLARDIEKDLSSRLVTFQKINKQLNDQVEVLHQTVGRLQHELSTEKELKSNKINELEQRIVEVTSKRYHEDVLMEELLLFLSHSLKHVKRKHRKPLESSHDVDELILIDMVRALIMKYPSKFKYLFKSKFGGNAVDLENSTLLTQVGSDMVAPNNNHTLPAISNYDSILDTFDEEGSISIEGRSHYIDSIIKDQTPSLNKSIQTDGYISHSEGGALWLSYDDQSIDSIHSKSVFSSKNGGSVISDLSTAHHSLYTFPYNNNRNYEGNGSHSIYSVKSSNDATGKVFYSRKNKILNSNGPPANVSQGIRRQIHPPYSYPKNPNLYKSSFNPVKRGKAPINLIDDIALAGKPVSILAPIYSTNEEEHLPLRNLSNRSLPLELSRSDVFNDSSTILHIPLHALLSGNNSAEKNTGRSDLTDNISKLTDNFTPRTSN